MSSTHYYLKIDELHMSKGAAERELKKILTNKGIRDVKFDSIITIEKNNKKRAATFFQLIKEMQQKGYIEEFHVDINEKDPIWGGGLIGFATNLKSAVFKIEYAGKEFEVKTPARMFPIENDLTDDILFYRKASCEKSNDAGFDETCRFYRAYLFSCMSMIDTFINRHILIYEHMKNQNPIFDELKDTKFNVELRLELLFKLTTEEDFKILKDSEEWCKFVELKSLRNDIVHTVNPYFGIEIKSMAENFNKVRKGIGGLLETIMKYQEKEPIGYIQKLKTAPLVTFIEK